MSSQKNRIHKSAVGRLVLDHDIAKLVHVDAEVYVADALERIVDEDEITSSIVPSESEAGGGILDLGGEPQYDSKVTTRGKVRLESTGVILDSIVRLDGIGLVHANNVRTVLAGEPLDLEASRVGFRVEDAYYIGNVVIRETGVLLAYPARIEDILGRCRGPTVSTLRNYSLVYLGKRRLGDKPCVASSPSIGERPEEAATRRGPRRPWCKSTSVRGGGETASAA